MKRFLYYFPGTLGMNEHMLAEFGVLDRFKFEGQFCGGLTTVMNGPAGSGVIVSYGQQPVVIPSGTAATAFDWTECERFWVAKEGLPPGPHDLLRGKNGIIGADLILGDGNTWRVPLIKKWNGDYNLPQSLVSQFENSKRLTRWRVKPQYESIAQLSERIAADFLDQKSFPLDQVMQDCAQLLAVNYRLGIDELGALALLDNDSCLQILRVATDQFEIYSRTQAAQSTGVAPMPEGGNGE